jgi:hypothetical protein
MEINWKLDKALQRVGNCIFNKGGKKEDKAAWLYIKEYLKNLENENEDLRNKELIALLDK